MIKKNKKENKNMVIGINASFARKSQTGMGQVTLNFLKKLSECKIEEFKFILYLEEDLPKEIKLPKNFEKRIVIPSFWKRDDLVRKIWWEKFLLPRRVKKDKCEVFLSLYQNPFILSSLRHVMVVHDIIPTLFPQYLNNWRKMIYQGLTEKAIKKADKILAVSKRTEKDLIQHLGIAAEKITVNYIDVDDIYKKKPTKDRVQKVLKKYRLSPGYILAGGGMEVRKNIEGVIRAYKFLQEKFSDPQNLPELVIYGKLLPQLAPLATDTEKLLKELNFTKKVKLLDAVPQNDLPVLFQNAQVFVYPSHYEGFGMPPLEAMNMGTPVIMSKNSSLPEVGLDSVLYCNSTDIHDIAMVMRNVLKNQELRKTLAQRGKERARNFSWKKFTEKVLRVLENEK